MDKPNMKQFKLIAWENVKTIEDVKLVIRAMCGELGFSDENQYYDHLEKSNLLGDVIKEVPQEVPSAS